MSDTRAEMRRPIELAFSYTEDEYLSASRLFSTRKRDPKFERILGGVFVAVLALIFVLAGDPYFGGFMVAFMLASLAVGYLARRLRPRNALRRDPKFREPFRVSLAEEGIRISSTDSEAVYGWQYFPKLVETPAFLFFVYADEMYFLVPKRGLLDPRQEPALGELLRRKFAGRVETYGLPEAPGPEREYVPPPEPPDWR